MCIAFQDFSSLRCQPGPGQPLSSNVLKHADEQTLAALTAVRQASTCPTLRDASFEGWAIVAAPAFIGRTMVAASLQRYAIEGAWGMSPHVIPHRTQHSVSGTISQILGIHGPNFGTGGGPADAGQALLAASTLLAQEHSPGVWVVLTCWHPELIPDQPIPAGMVCHAVALALVVSDPGWPGLKITIRPKAGLHDGIQQSPLHDFDVRNLVRFLRAGTPIRQRWSLGTWGDVEFERGASLSMIPPPKSARLTARWHSVDVKSPGGGNTW
jgi:hypothetical protein